MKKVLITASSGEALRDLLRARPLDLDCGGPKRMPDGTVSVIAYVTENISKELNRGDYTCRELEDMEEQGRARQSEVGTGDRYKGGKIVPRGTGNKIREEGKR